MKLFFQKAKPFCGAFLVIVLIMLLVTAVLIFTGDAAPQEEPVPPEVLDKNPADPSPSPDSSPLPEETPPAPPSVSESPAIPDEPDSIPEDKPIIPAGFTGFTYNGALQEGPPVDDAWFADAVFLGNSLMDGFRLHSGLLGSHIYGEKSISVFNAFTENTIRLDGGAFGTLIDALALRQYNKVYIMLGVNELASKPEAFRAQYELLTDRVQELQPNADIYLHAVMPVTEEKALSSSTYNNVNIQAFNEQIADLCEQKGFYYVDTYTAFAQENGCLPADASWDGVHLNSSGYKYWLEYVRTHTAMES